MKNTKWLGTLAVTAAGTLVAALCASRGMPVQNAPVTRIAVAAVDIDLGQRLAPRFIKLIEWPAGKIPPGTFDDPHQLDGRVLCASIVRGEPLTEGGLQPLGASDVTLHLGDHVTAAVPPRDAKQFHLARSGSLLSLKRGERAVVRGYDPDTVAWLSLLDDPWAPVMPPRAGKPAGA